MRRFLLVGLFATGAAFSSENAFAIGDYPDTHFGGGVQPAAQHERRADNTLWANEVGSSQQIAAPGLRSGLSADDVFGFSGEGVSVEDHSAAGLDEVDDVCDAVCIARGDRGGDDPLGGVFDAAPAD